MPRAPEGPGGRRAPTLLTVVLWPRRVLRRSGLRRARWWTPSPQAPRWSGADGLVRAEPGPQRRGGVAVRQVDATTCGSTVLVVLRAGVDAGYRTALLAGGAALTARRLGAVQRRVHRESTRFWPRALGTSPWGMVGWLRRSGAARLRVRLVDVADPADVRSALAAVDAATAAGWGVPLLVGSAVPRHWCLALPSTAADRPGWLVFEPSSGTVRVVAPSAVQRRSLAPVLGFDDLQAVLLPAGAPADCVSVGR